MPTANNTAVQDERLVTLPMWIIEAVRTDIRLEVHVWSEMQKRVEQSLACDVKLPPGTLFSKGTKLSTLMLGIQQRLDFPPHAREFAKQ